MQLKDLIANLSKKVSIDSPTLMRMYMAERFLERMSKSKYAKRFIVKGGILVSAMVGPGRRSTMDVDATVSGIDLNAENVARMATEIAEVEVDDGVRFVFESSSRIMDSAEYPGIRIKLNALFGKSRIPVKLDISTGDAITPEAVLFKYPLMLEKRCLAIWAYNKETILAEKLETIISRGDYNTRMRDFYDICMIKRLSLEDVDTKAVREALLATAERRKTLDLVLNEGKRILGEISAAPRPASLWKTYASSHPYAKDLKWEEAIAETIDLYSRLFS